MTNRAQEAHLTTQSGTYGFISSPDVALITPAAFMKFTLQEKYRNLFSSSHKRYTA